MTKTKIQRRKIYIISRTGGFIFLLSGFIIAKRFNLFGFGEYSYVTLVFMTAIVSLVDILFDFIFRKKRNKN